MYWDAEQIARIEKRLDLLESVFKKLAEIDMRLDTLEFNSNAPTKPGISEKLSTLEYKLEHVLDFLNKKYGDSHERTESNIDP
jgi:hypothetical protein